MFPILRYSLAKYSPGASLGYYTDCAPIKDLWETPNNGATNEIGFNVIPGGWRDEKGVYGQMSQWAWFWSSSVQTEYCAWARILINDMTIIERYNILTPVGQSVRCIKEIQFIR